MVTRAEMGAIARRYDTAMARAMLRALGMTGPRRGLRSRSRKRRFSHLLWCFRNHGSPMDRG